MTEAHFIVRPSIAAPITDVRSALAAAVDARWNLHSPGFESTGLTHVQSGAVFNLRFAFGENPMHTDVAVVAPSRADRMLIVPLLSEMRRMAEAVERTIETAYGPFDGDHDPQPPSAKQARGGVEYLDIG